MSQSFSSSSRSYSRSCAGDRCWRRACAKVESRRSLSSVPRFLLWSGHDLAVRRRRAGGGGGGGYGQSRRARMVRRSSPVRLRGSTRNFTPSISPTPSSDDGSLLSSVSRSAATLGLLPPTGAGEPASVDSGFDRRRWSCLRNCWVAFSCPPSRREARVRHWKDRGRGNLGGMARGMDN
jgi:hypothetical protein